MKRVVRKAATAGAFLLAAVVVIGCERPGTAPAAPPDKSKLPPTKVTVAKPIVKTVTEFTDVTGTMKAVKRVEIRPQVSGYIKEVHFADGAEVEADQLLVTIDPSLYKADLDRAKGELASAEASAKLAVVEEKRFARLRETAGVSQEEYDQAVAKQSVSQANVLTAAANVERARQNLEWTQVRAPFAGRVDRILINEGNLVAGGTMAPTVLTTLITTDPIYAYFDLDEESVLYYLELINKGKFTSVREKNIPIEFRLKGEEGYPHKGELGFAGAELNPLTGTLSIRATIDNPLPYKFTPGMFVRAKLPGAVVENAILVPDSAVVVDQADKVVYTVNAENKVEVKKVKLGPLTEGLRVVASGLEPTDRVVIRGMQRVQAGVPVEPEPGEIVAGKPPGTAGGQTDAPSKPQVPAAPATPPKQ